MFEGLAQAIDELVVPATGDAIVELRALADRLDAEIAAAESSYERSGTHGVDGYASMASFARHRCRVTVNESRRIARRARRLTAWPELGDAWRTAALTGTQVELACAIVPERHVARFASVAADNVTWLGWLDATDTATALRHWVAAADDADHTDPDKPLDDHTTEPPAPPAELSLVEVGDETLLRGAYHEPDSVAVITAALAAATTADRDGERRHPTRRRADALVDICHHYLATATRPDALRPAGQLTIVADIDALYAAALHGAGVRTPAQLDTFLARHPMGELERGLFHDALNGATGTARTLDGNPIGPGLLTTITSSGTLELLLTARGRPLHLGRRARTFTPAQRHAVLTRDHGCRAPGCSAPPEHCDIHHVIPWEAGGTTDITNAVAKCRRCHHDHHRRRLRDHLDPDGTYTITLPDGTTLTTHPPRTPPPLPLEPSRTLPASSPERPSVTGILPPHWSSPPPSLRPAGVAHLPDGADEPDGDSPGTHDVRCPRAPDDGSTGAPAGDGAAEAVASLQRRLRQVEPNPVLDRLLRTRCRHRSPGRLHPEHGALGPGDVVVGDGDRGQLVVIVDRTGAVRRLGPGPNDRPGAGA